MKQLPAILVWLLLSAVALAAGDDFTALSADRAAIERVYHAHRTGEKPPFEEAMPPALLERLVRQEMRKESVLRKAYGVEITPALLATEIARIEKETRAPEMLAELKRALGGDAGRFARSVARPIIVERELRSRFDHDDRLHAEQRRAAEQARASLLAGGAVAEMQEIVWQLGSRSAAASADAAERTSSTAPSPTKAVAKSASYSVAATAQVAQALSAPGTDPAAKPDQYFADLDPRLQNVLHVQLHQPGAVSAVIEMPGAFLVFQARTRTATELRAASLSVPKRNYDEWLAAQPE